MERLVLGQLRLSDPAIWISGVNGQLWHFDGSAWKTAFAGTKVTLQAVHGSADNDIWFAGESGYFSRWNGVYLTAVGDRTAAGQHFRSIWNDDSGAPHVYGGRGQLFARSSERWLPTSEPSTPGLFQVIPLRGTDGGLYGVSPFGEIGTYLPDFNTWLIQPSGTSQPLLSIWANAEDDLQVLGTAAGELFVVGDSGAILRHRGPGPI